MANNKKPQISQNVFPQKENPLKTQKTHTVVRQDKVASECGRIASQQPAPRKNVMRSQKVSSNGSRSQNKSTLTRKTIYLTLWVKPIVKAELQRIAKKEGLSVSAAGSAFLERALQQRVDMQYGPLLKPVVEKAIAREIRTMSTRLAWLLVRVAFDGGQTRSLVTNILGRQPGMTPEILKTILEGSGKTAKANITRRTPQITELIEAVEQWIVAGEKEQQE